MKDGLKILMLFKNFRPKVVLPLKRCLPKLHILNLLSGGQTTETAGLKPLRWRFALSVERSDGAIFQVLAGYSLLNRFYCRNARIFFPVFDGLHEVSHLFGFETTNSFQVQVSISSWLSFSVRAAQTLHRAEAIDASQSVRCCNGFV
jgi:hypothetical protein